MATTDRAKAKRYVYKWMDSPLGRLKLVATDDGLAAILWERDRPRRVQAGDRRRRRQACGHHGDRASTRGVFRGPPDQIHDAAGPTGHRLSAQGLERTLDHPVRRDALLRPDRQANRKRERRARGWGGKRQESHFDCHALPPRHWCDRQAHRLRRRPRCQGVPART